MNKIRYAFAVGKICNLCASLPIHLLPCRLKRRSGTRLDRLLDLFLIFRYGHKHLFQARLVLLDACRWFELAGYGCKQRRKAEHTYRAIIVVIPLPLSDDIDDEYDEYPIIIIGASGQTPCRRLDSPSSVHLSPNLGAQLPFRAIFPGVKLLFLGTTPLP